MLIYICLFAFAGLVHSDQDGGIPKKPKSKSSLGKMGIRDDRGPLEIDLSGKDAEFLGAIEKNEVRRVIREHIREIRNCFERELRRSPDAKGTLVLEWDIEEEGRVSLCKVKTNPFNDDTVALCIASRVKTWHFPAPPKDQVVRVTYPIVFRSPK